MLCVHHITQLNCKQFRVFAITSNKVHFCKEFFNEKIPAIYLSATMNKINMETISPSNDRMSIVNVFKRLQT